MGMSDDFEVEGRTKTEVMKKMIRHAKSYHKMTNEEIKDPRMKKLMNKEMWKRRNNNSF